MAWKRSLTPQSVYRRQLAIRLRELREDAGLSLAEVGAAIEVNQGTLSRLENGERGTTPLLVKALLDCYGVTDPSVREDILDLVRADRAQSKPWWRKYSAVLAPTRYDGYLVLESSALSLCTYEPLVVPGLLQTPAYAEAVIGGMGATLTPRQVKSLVDVRMARQEKRLNGDNPVKLWAIIDETALIRQVGSSEIMREQFSKLVDFADLPNVTVQLLPLSTGAHPGLYGPFVIMGFPAPASDLVWLENPRNSVYLEALEDVDAYADAFDQLRARALSPAETKSRIRQMSKELLQ